jgi:hypothetical protein
MTWSGEYPPPRLDQSADRGRVRLDIEVPVIVV